MRGNHTRASLYALAVYVALTLVFTWPVITQFGTRLIGSYATDNFEILWKMWWVPEALFDRGLSPFFAAHLYYPFGYDLSWGELTPLHTFYMMPVTIGFGEETTYNLAVLLSYVLTGWFTYFLARRWLRPLTADDALLHWAALFSGAVFAFSVYRIQHIAGGHLNLVHTQWLVLALYSLDRWLEQPRLRDAALLGLAVSLAALSTWYYAFMLALLLPVYALGYRPRWRALLRDRRAWLGVGAAALIFALLCGPFLVPYMQASASGETAIPVEQAAFWAASPLDYLMLNPGHPVWGDAIQGLMWPFPDVEMPIEFMISVGWITLALGVFAWTRTTASHWRALKWTIAGAFLLSLGPFLNIGRLPTPMPLPVLLLREVLPVADSVRSWGRFSLFVVLGLALLAGAAWTRLLRDRAGWRVILALVLWLALFAAWDGPAGLIEIEPQPVDLWLAQQPGAFAVMQYPLEAALSGGAMLSTRYHDKPATYATGTFFAFLYRQRHPELLAFPADEALDQLQAWEVCYILVKTDAIDTRTPFSLDDVSAQPRLRHVITLENQAVYELLPAPDTATTAPTRCTPP